MLEENNRNSPRIEYEARLECAPLDGEERAPAVMRNYSDGGMYFESDVAFRVGEIINIHMKSHSEGVYGPEGGRLYRASVQWCRPLETDEDEQFGVGIRYLENYDHYPRIIR